MSTLSFEIVSGFTTTGASTLPEVRATPVRFSSEKLPVTGWGPAGVLVFLLAISLPGGAAGGFTMHLLQLLMPSPNVGKLVPGCARPRRSSIYVYPAHCSGYLPAAWNMPLFDAICTAFGTAGTGGFGIKNEQHQPATVHTFRMYARC